MSRMQRHGPSRWGAAGRAVVDGCRRISKQAFMLVEEPTSLTRSSGTSRERPRATLVHRAMFYVVTRVAPPQLAAEIDDSPPAALSVGGVADRVTCAQ